MLNTGKESETVGYGWMVKGVGGLAAEVCAFDVRKKITKSNDDVTERFGVGAARLFVNVCVAVVVNAVPWAV